MSDEILHVVCPHCHATNRVPGARLSEGGKCGQCKELLFPNRPLDLTSAGFHHHARHDDIPMVLDFWADWCGPCKMMTPILQQAAGMLEPRVRLGKINTDAEPALAQQFGIRSIPTLVLTRKGEELSRASGAMALHDFLRWVQEGLRAG